MTRSLGLRVWSALWLFGLSSCAVAQLVGNDCGDESVCDQARRSSARGGGAIGSSAGPPSTGQITRQRSGLIQRVDVLFVVGDTPSMQFAGDALADVVPQLVMGLASGDADGGGAPSFRPVGDAHFGVISARMLGSGQNEQDCGGNGDGRLSNTGCLAPSAPFASMQGRDTAERVALDLACMVRLGASGCEPPQPLEAMLKALWPSAPVDPLVGQLTFVDGSRTGAAGNGGFLRSDSLIVVIVVSAADDCSLRGPLDLDAHAMEAWLHSCTAAPDPRFDVSRYVDGLRALRAGADDLVMFFAIAGAPALAVGAEALSQFSFEQDDERETYYEQLLRSLQFDAVDDRGTPGTGDDLPFAVCTPDRGAVFPAPRLVSLARAFGPNGLVQSLCEPNLQFASEAILRSIGRRLGPPGI